MSVYFVADTHFGDENIMKYENRPFASVDEMNKALVENWNKVVKTEDVVYHLGDVGDESFISQLNGTKYLIKGNHDKKENDFYRKMGFHDVYDMPVIYNDFWILSHEPLYVNRNMPYANLFGHIHNNPIYKTSSIQSYCVSVERIQYTPIAFEAIRKCMMSSIKMIVTDLDGTLLKKDKTISSYTKEVLLKAREKGILVVVATARPIRGVKENLPFLEYDAAIFHNGAVVYNHENRLEGFGIENPNRIISSVLKDYPGRHVAVEANDVMYSNFDAEELWPGVVYQKTADFAEVNHKIADKLIIEAKSLEEMRDLEKYMPKDLYLQLSENVIAMVMNRKATKVEGIKQLLKEYGISLDEVVAFGDDYNDIDMLKACGIGVSVGNALEEVKRVANYICDTNEQDGLAKWLSENLL